jgi:hypothetical protein
MRLTAPPVSGRKRKLAGIATHFRYRPITARRLAGAPALATRLPAMVASGRRPPTVRLDFLSLVIGHMAMNFIKNAMFATGMFALIATRCFADSAVDRTQLPIPDVEPKGYTELDVRNVKPPKPYEALQPPEGAPNVIVFLLDDVGFSQASLFGGLVEMPTLDAIAEQGLVYNRFHTTAVCSATRTALLTGRNHHQNNMGSIAETATAFPGNTGMRPNYIAALPKILRYNGYKTAMFGKNHEIPPWQTGPAADQTLWPSQVGFEKFYGFFWWRDRSVSTGFGGWCNAYQNATHRGLSLHNRYGESNH